MSGNVNTFETIPLYEIDIDDKIKQLKIMKKTADAFAAIGQSVIPGVPDIPAMAKYLVKQEITKLLSQMREEINKLIQLLFLKLTDSLIKLIPIINIAIAIFNGFIEMIDTLIDFFFPIIKGFFSLIIAVTVVYVVSLVLAMIPSITIAWGAGTSFTMHIPAAKDIRDIAKDVLDKLKKVAYYILAALQKILGLYGFLEILLSMMAALGKGRQDSIDETLDDQNKSAEDYSNTENDETDGESTIQSDSEGQDESITKVQCLLPDGSVEELTPEECTARGGTWGEVDLMNAYNQCLLRLGECQKTSLEASDCNDIKKECDSMCVQLGDLCDYQLDESVISSLLNLHNDVTVEKATKNKGDRYGFYQNTIKNKNRGT